MADGLNQARALRVAEIINDYRTLLMHITQQSVQAPSDDYNEEGYKVIRDGLAAAQALMSSTYNPCATPAHNNAEIEKAELRRVILDASARRFQAHRIYLKVAAARRWVLNRQNILRGQRPGPQHAAQLKNASNTFHAELAQVTEQYVVADLRAADTRAGHWLNEDPSLSTILQWIRSHP
ncbi:uncharacterized protein BP01DRAFT_387358 [Aspergillus saccharolyticus JOP 1030-1]|uniref:Uncharacterized protein n=1 Tax=Aspergillus saccharolyticus JOP 1030-1 TaxID=1450539 RepID=A0A318Z0K8_9EURO|nr:hypothetical protein BP01DRAFT_387358 [Aspergillus saccharolyticus JOP 1030-1]PYH40439.1 hypothetical protein BP01DRAFT_387358 [Aspergillus saccharolyticus JOP 1030-1]